MGELDDEFEKIIENSDMEDLGNRYSSFSVEYLVSSIANASRTLALLTELLQASFEHYSHDGADDERPGLTANQVEILIKFFELSAQFNGLVLGNLEDDDEEDED